MTFKPNWVSPPSDTIFDILEEKNVTVEEFTERMDLGETITELLLEGKWIISKEIANKLSEVLGSTPEFWRKRDKQYWKGLRSLNKLDF